MSRMGLLGGRIFVVVPGGQGKQPAPTWGAKKSGAHGVHDSDPSFRASVPSAQGWHAEAAAAEASTKSVLTGHATQASPTRMLPVSSH
jgi:hypothetical protein